MKVVRIDWSNHYIVGSLLTLAQLGATDIFLTVKDLPLQPHMLLPVASLLASLLREWYNKTHGGQWSNSDIGWTVGGGSSVSLGALLGMI